ncbi:MAG: sulfotransferase domain-containing protein [Leptolyngbya sp. SIO1D8]|nr:sulfotransferase domain-containing protein [Leptolyngbya sp. SIO1D8]
MNKPDFIIIGAMKCATTTLHEQLAQQPGVFMSEPKEPNFFSDDDQYAKGLDSYFSLFSSASKGDLCGESSTHYTKLPTYPKTLDRIKQHLPEVKLIYVMRHPIERLVSQYIHEWSQRTVSGNINEDILSFKPLTQYSQYSMQIHPYLESFDSANILPVFSENLHLYPQRELERVCQFIGYQGTPQWQEFTGHQHISTERMRDSVWRDAIVNQPILRLLRRTFVPKSIRIWVRSFWQMKKRPELTTESHQYLEKLFDQDLETLGQWLGINLTCANFKAAVDIGPSGFTQWNTMQSIHPI